MKPVLPAALSRWFTGVALFCAMLTAVSATTVVPPDFAQLVNESDYVVRAVVKSVTPEWRTNQGQRAIFTLVELDVREVIAGTPPRPLVLQLLGGRIGDQAMVIAGAPRFVVGQEDILFVSGNGKNISPLFAMMHGRYPVLKDPASGREYMARSNHVPLQDTSEVALPMSEGGAAGTLTRMKSPAQALSPDQFAQKIKAAVNPQYTRARQN